MTTKEIKIATKNFTKPVGVRVGKSKRYTRYLQPGLWDLTGKLMLRSRSTGRHLASAAYGDDAGIAALVTGCDICEY